MCQNFDLTHKPPLTRCLGSLAGIICEHFLVQTFHRTTPYALVDPSSSWGIFRIYSGVHQSWVCVFTIFSLALEMFRFFLKE